MNLAISNIAWKSSDDEIMYDYIRQAGFAGIEIAPTRIFPSLPYENLDCAAEWSDNLHKHHILRVVSIQSICYGRKEKLFGTKRERESLFAYAKKAVDFAVSIGCQNLVFGCPRNRVIDSKLNWRIGVDFFRELAIYAERYNLFIGMEANPDIYGTNYINTTCEALSLIKEVNSPALKLNLDIGTMIQNKEKTDVLIGEVKNISHVHVSEPFLKPIEKRLLHKQVADILRAENYQGFISIEMSTVDDLAILYKTMAYVKEVFGTYE